MTQEQFPQQHRSELPFSETEIETAKAGFEKLAKRLLINDLLPGGGVEESETTENALHRECLEEVGLEVKILEPLGLVEQYRDVLSKKYEVYGFLAELASDQRPPTTTQDDEIGLKLEWLQVEKAIRLLEKKITHVENARYEEYPGDAYQSKLFNSQTALIFLKEAREMLKK